MKGQPNPCRIGFLAVVVSSLITLCDAQTKWFKYEGNPVLDVGPKASWDDRLVNVNRVVVRDSTYLMWYTGWGIGTNRVGTAISKDGIQWIKDPSNPVLNPNPKSWDNNETVLGYVIARQSVFEMWYTGGNGQTYAHLGYATSPDGIHWVKNRNPVVSKGPWMWNGGSIAAASALGPDTDGTYKLWFVGFDTDFRHAQIGYAVGLDATRWKMNDEPVLRVGNPDAWDSYRVQNPRVLRRADSLEMWYAGTRTDHRRMQTGYATSSDGIHWTKSFKNPVLRPGPEGSWDDESAFVGDVIFDGQMYYMWYSGSDGSIVRSGLALSPSGFEVKLLTTASGFVPPRTGAVRVAIKVDNPKGLEFEAVINAPSQNDYKRDILPLGLRQHDRFELFDDGTHDDGQAGDGLFANAWIPKEEKVYFLDLKLRSEKRRGQTFVLKEAAFFASVGPIECDSLIITGEETANPGDTVLVKLALRNRGASGTAPSVEASLSPADLSLADISAVTPTYGNIPPGQKSITSGYYRIFIKPDCPSNATLKIDATVSSSGFNLWRSTVFLKVVPPWWRSNIAYGVYGALLLASIGGLMRYLDRRKLRTEIRRLEQEQALERERSRISQDMHDEVGARLTEIGILSEIARREIQNPQIAEAQIQKISQASREVIASIGEIIWAIDSQNASLDDLVAYLREYTSKLLRSTTIKHQFASPDKLPPLPLREQIRRNIFLVVKESLNNIVKHSSANEVLVQVSFQSQNMEITIQDDGKGFDRGRLSRFGNGLRNMASRMKDIGGSFEITSSPGQGTKATLQIMV